ncbi:MAG: murein L,D-transpeptidase catalytic domain family protein [Bacteroidetes bacterium]|nr:murein L,D-transpeptidase catalytic domain family protein [Bacteroidota bacterium]
MNKFNEFNFKKWDNLKFDVFFLAYKGYNTLLAEGIISNSRYLSIINYSISANKKRLWVLDMQKNKIAINDLVSHGKNSGEEYAHYFSNSHESYKSSLGFYITGMPYQGKNDYSLRLHGVEEGINDNAYERGIVIHGADYVSNKFIRAHKRLGRSQGCPAVPLKLNPWLIKTIQGGSCMFIYYPSENYLKNSPILNSDF